MIDIASLDPELVQARGIYSTIRAAHEDEMKRMSALCGRVMSLSALILKSAHPRDDEKEPDDGQITDFLNSCEDTLEEIRDCASRISSISSQREEWKDKAWPKPSKGKKDVQAE